MNFTSAVESAITTIREDSVFTFEEAESLVNEIMEAFGRAIEMARQWGENERCLLDDPSSADADDWDVPLDELERIARSAGIPEDLIDDDLVLRLNEAAAVAYGGGNVDEPELADLAEVGRAYLHTEDLVEYRFDEDGTPTQWAYFADESRYWVVIDELDLAELGESLSSSGKEEREAYSDWCSYRGYVPDDEEVEAWLQEASVTWDGRVIELCKMHLENKYRS